MLSTINNLLAGAYTVTVIDQKGCQKLDTFQITQPSLLNISVVQNGFDLQANSPTGGTPPFTYVWSDNSERDSIHAINLCPNTYTLTVTDQNSCFDVDSVEIKDQTLVNKNSLFLNYSIYPNPTSENIYLNGIPVDAKVFVTDILGNVIISNPRTNDFINFSDFSAGTYFVNVVVDGMKSVKKITVKK